jgi:hypothetical protein
LQRKHHLLISAAFCGALLSPAIAAAQSVAANPNADEWTLIKLTATDITAAKAGAATIVGLYDGYTDCRDTDLTGRCTNFTIAGGRYTYYDNHGTHTAGIIEGKKYGVATSASVLNYGVFDSTGYVATGTKLTAAWRDAATRGASIASMSFGCAGMALCFSSTEVSAMASASLAGTLFVKAAGNDGVNLKSEYIGVSAADGKTALSRLILVGSVNVKGAISTFSNRPGEGCLTTVGMASCTSANQWKYHFIVAPGEAIYSNLPGNAYGYMSGTSMATPVVAGAAALLESRWPVLKAQPASVAGILFNSATDLGAPGVDAVYGWGLLNVTKAFQNSGATKIVTASGASVTVSDASISTSGVFGKTSAVLGGVTAFDAYGRDYRIDQVSNFTRRRSLLADWTAPGAALGNLGRQADWSGDFFAPAAAAPRAWSHFGPGGAGASLQAQDRSLRFGLDAPLSGGALSLRLTGAGSTRSDLAADTALRPLSFFASTALLNDSALVSFAAPVGSDGRLMVFSSASVGAHVNPQLDGLYEGVSPFALRAAEDTAALTFGAERSGRRQAGFGVGYWQRLGGDTVVGVSLSTLSQRHAFYDLASNLDLFNHPTRVTNLGAALSRRAGPWDLYASTELSRTSASAADGPIALSATTLASAEIGARRADLLVSGRGRSDALTLSLAVPPTAIGGALRLNYLTPTADGLDRQTVTRDVGMDQITGRRLRLEAGYSLRSKKGWALSVSGGADLTRDGDYLAMAQFLSRF